MNAGVIAVLAFWAGLLTCGIGLWFYPVETLLLLFGVIVLVLLFWLSVEIYEVFRGY